MPNLKTGRRAWRPQRVAILGLGAAYTGHFGRRIGPLAFVALNLLSVSLVFANPTVTAVAAPLVLAILAWHWRGSRAAAPVGA